MVEKMKPIFNRVKHNPPETYGDCIRACIASILERDDVPHTFDGRSPQEAWQAIRDYLKPLGFAPFFEDIDGDISLDELFHYMKINNPDSIYMLLAKSIDTDHCVVCQGDKIIHNPAWYSQPITGPHSLGVWIIIVIGKI